jgi:hypothetical protein
MLLSFIAQVALKLVYKKDLDWKACSRVRAEMMHIKKLSGHKNVVNLFESKYLKELHLFETAVVFFKAL